MENEGKKRMKAQGKHKEDNRGEITTIETENQWDKKLNLGGNFNSGGDTRI